MKHAFLGKVALVVWKAALLVFVHVGLAYAQTPFYQSLVKDYGFDPQRVNTAIKDAQGYLWLGGANGLYRWDSKLLKRFSENDGLPSNEIFYLYQDSRKRIWIVSNTEELCYYYNGNIFNSRNDQRLSKIKIFYGSALLEFKGRIYYNDVHIHQCSFNLDIDSVIAKKIEGGNKLVNHDTLADDFQLLLHARKENNALNQFDEVYVQKSDSRRLVAINRRLKKFVVYYGLDSIEYIGQCEDDKLYRLYYSDGSPIEQYEHRMVLGRTNKVSVEFDEKLENVICLPGVILATLSKDVLVFSEKPVTRFQNSNRNLDNTLFLFKDNDRIYLINKNYEIVDLQTNTVVNLVRETNLNMYSFIRSDGRYCLLSPRSIHCFRTPAGTIESKMPHPHGNYKYVVYSGRSDRLFLINKGKGIYTLNKDFWTRVDTQLVYATQEPLVSVLEDSKGRLWYSTLSDVWYVNPDRKSRVHIPMNRPNVLCRHILEDKYGNIFLVSSAGLYVVGRTRIYHLAADTLLSDNNCNQLCIDSLRNELWVATINGLTHLAYQVSGDSISFFRKNIFFKGDGLPANEVTSILLDKGRVYIGTTEGVGLLEQPGIRPMRQDIPLYIESVTVNDRLSGIDSLARLKHHQNVISIEFSAIYYDRRSRLVARYSLINENNDTVTNTTQESRIQFVALKDGKYRLVLYVYDRDYPYIRSRELVIPISIAPVFYKTWWFWGLIIAAGIGFSYFLYSSHTQKKQERMMYDNKLLSLKMEALKAEMNPHFIFNCLNAIKDFIAKNDLEQSQYYLSRFAKLIRLALYNTQKDYVYLDDEMKFIDIYVELEQMRFAQKFTYQKTIHVQQDEIQLPAMLIQPFIENAIRHGRIGQLGRPGLLAVEIYQHIDELTICIRDNGVGIDAANAIKDKTAADHRSMAISIIRERINVYNRMKDANIRYQLQPMKEGAYHTEVVLVIKYGMS